MSDELKPCPHCGGPVTIETNGIYFWIERPCDCGVPTGTREEVIAEWNLRYTENPSEAKEGTP